MLKVAVTGGIGAGKSVVCAIFEKLGIPVFNADIEAKRLMENDTAIKEKIMNYFGMGVFDDNFKLNRTKFAGIIFNNKEALSVINGIVHPAVKQEFNQWAQQQTTKYVIHEAAILFESGLEANFQKTITVTAPVEIRIERVMKRDNISRDKVLERINNQIDDETRLKKSDLIVVNDGKQMLLPQILTIHNNLTR